MAEMFILDVTTGSADVATLRLQDGEGRHVAAHEVSLAAHAPSLWEAVFDTRQHVARMMNVEAPAAVLAKVGAFLGEQVLGRGIAAALAAGRGQRTLLVRLPDPTRDGLAAKLARVPWEIARAPGDTLTLLERNVVVRAAPAGATPAGATPAGATPAGATPAGATPARETALALEAGQPVRVLLVFAEAPEARPLAARLERERLLDLFFEEVLPRRNVEVEVLCHGVTRRRLTEQMRERGGYHVVHWSGHGQGDTLEIARDEGETAGTRITAKELVELFANAGGFIPAVVFLSACEGGRVVDRAADGFTGTALSLVREGVKQVVAMRHRVGDRYARRLARRFYRRLLADGKAHAVDEALALAKGELKADGKRQGEYGPVDWATPMVFGVEPVRVEPGARRSAQMDRRGPRPQPLLPSGSRELDPPRGFVGRGGELTELAGRWLEGGEAPVAVVQGLAGIGKTSLAGEMIHLWFGRFDYVLCFQARGGALSIEEFYRRLDQRLTLASPAYRERCAGNEMARVYVEPGPAFKGTERDEALRNNLVDALAAERILVVLDNFETNLLRTGGPEYAAQDPAWDGLLEALGDRLRGTGSRVLVTCRHKLAALKKHGVWMPLGPLTREEAALFFEGQPPIRQLLFGDDAAQALAKRILDVSRGHPLILARIADLARPHYHQAYGLAEAGRTALAAALDRIQGDGYGALPEVFAGARTEDERERERAYLDDVAIGAVDLLIERLKPGARSVLWIVTRAGEPVTVEMIAAAVGRVPAMDLDELCASGLVVREGEAYAFHELVAERAAAWVEKHPDERRGKTEADVWTAYGVRYGAVFEELVAASKRDLASEAGRWAIRYLVRARAFERLGGLACSVITGTLDPVLLEQVIADLHCAAGEVPAGEARWSLRTNLADALRRAGRPDQALSLCTQAAEEAEAAEHWSHLGWIFGNWAHSLGDVGHLDRARVMYMKSARAMRRSGRSRADIIAMELEALRVEVKQGRAGAALPAIEAKLDEVRTWWALRQQGQPGPESPDREVTARAFVGGLDVAHHANHALERWQPCLDLLGEVEQVQRDLGTGEHEVARTRFNRYAPLLRLGKLAEAKAVLEGCLDVDRRIGDAPGEGTDLGALADVWNRLGDPTQALALAHRALAVCNCLPDPGARAVSHCNLALYLHAAGTPAEAPSHHLAALVYTLVTGLDPRRSLRNLAVDIRESAARNETFTFPPLPTLLADPAFSALRAYLTSAGADLPALQARIDALVAEARAAAP
jgi:tetratricopeptide (TPR) repeat protein